MSEKRDRETPMSVHCRRLDRPVAVKEHAACPYCFGAKQKIETGEHEEFCDFRPGEDPVDFGFPPDGSRFGRG